MKLVINRETWLTGKLAELMGEDSCLYHPSGLSCAVGQYLQALGVSEKSLRYKSGPSAVHTLPEEAHWLVTLGKVNSGANDSITDINDMPKMRASAREAQLAAVFYQHDVEVTFRGDAKKATEKAQAWGS